MRRTLALLAVTAAMFTAAPASAAPAAPDAAGCTTDLLRFIVLYDGPIESWPSAYAGAARQWANCVV